jgi:GT2 family glycosyltransferase
MQALLLKSKQYSPGSVLSYTLEKLPVSIIIPTFNRAPLLQATVDQFFEQNFRDYEIWVIDQSDEGDAAANARYVKQTADKRLNYLHLDQQGLSNARNEGLARARGEIVIFVDDDVILLSPDFINAHLRVYDNPKIGGAVGRHVERTLRMNTKHTACHVSWTGRTIFNLFGTGPVRVRSCKGSNMSVRMAAIQQVGGFDRRIKFLDETDFSARIREAGWHLVFEPAAEVVHLSAPAGGVREKNKLQDEIVRFECTAYYILRHHGWLGVPPFIATFSLIAIIRALRFRSLKAFPLLCDAMFKGFRVALKEPDHRIPELVQATAAEP